MSVIIRESKLTSEKEDNIIKKIHELLNPETVTINHGLAMIMVVGEGLMNTPGVAQRAATAITEADVNIEMINQGSSEVSMMFGIESEGLNRALDSLYQAFFAKEKT